MVARGDATFRLMKSRLQVHLIFNKLTNYLLCLRTKQNVMEKNYFAQSRFVLLIYVNKP